jgi:mycothiol synthase
VKRFAHVLKGKVLLARIGSDKVLRKENKEMINTFYTDFDIRSPRLSDVEAVHRLIEACEIAEYGTPDLTLGDLRAMWEGPTFHLETDAWMVVDSGGRLVGYADVQHRQHVRVLPELAGQAIEEHFLNRVEGWATMQIPFAQTDARVTMFTWASDRNSAPQQAVLQAGFHEVRCSWRMEIEMSEAPIAPEWPDHIIVRTFVPEQDARTVHATIEEAFKDHWGHLEGDFNDWKHWAVEREHFNPSLWFLAFDGDEIAGASLCNLLEDAGWVDTLGVRRTWRRKGLGIALLLHSFGEFYRRGQQNVVLIVDSQNLTGATRLYERAGMHVARTYISYEKELRARIELSTQAIPI